jgi:hypothetical protein
VAQLEQRTEKMVTGVAWAGVYQSDTPYRTGMLTTHKGGLWICRRDSRGSTPGVPGSSWVLVVKSGTVTNGAHGDTP